MTVTLSPDMPAEDILAMFRQIESDGLIDYLVTTDPLGEEWVLGLNGQITKLTTPEAVAFLIGHQTTLAWLMAAIESRGMTLVRSTNG